MPELHASGTYGRLQPRGNYKLITPENKKPSCR